VIVIELIRFNAVCNWN